MLKQENLKLQKDLEEVNKLAKGREELVAKLEDAEQKISNANTIDAQLQDL